MKPLIIASRGSQLALWQANWIRDTLAAKGVESRIEIIKTTGDMFTGMPLARIGAKGVFTKEIEDALLAGTADLAVHSLKDLPTELPSGLDLAAIPAREDARDAVAGDLKQSGRAGTSSLRRTAQLTRLRPDLNISSIRGNVDTRLRKLDEGQYDAVVLAAAGLKRLGWENRIARYFAPEEMCPAVGQGALAVETRSEDAEKFRELLDDKRTRAAVTAERSLLHAMGGGCQVPIGAHATVTDGALRLFALIISPDGTQEVRGSLGGPVVEAQRIGMELALRLLDQGGKAILENAGLQ